MTIEDLGEVSQELIVLLEKRSLINLVELENFQIIDILSSSEGYVDKIVNLETSTYYHEILFDIIKNKESFSLDIFQLFENYFSTRFKNATTLEEKQDLLMTIEPTDLNKLITDFYQTEKNILTEKIQKNFSLLKGELSSLTPKEIIKSIVFTSALLLMIISKNNYVPPKNERFIGSPAYGSISYSYATRYAKQAMTDSLSSATPQSPTFATKSTKTTFHPKVVKMESAKVDQTLKSGKNKQTLSPTAKATKRAKLGSGTNRQKKAASITTATTSALTKSEQVKVIEQEVQALQGSSLISYIHNIEGTHLISPVGSTGCYGHTEQFNTIISYVLKSHPDWFLQPCDADHLIERRDSESLGMSRRNGATILLTPKVHQLKSKIDLNRDPDVTQVSQWILRTGEKTLDFLQNLDPEFAEANGINQELVAKQLEGCIKHDTQQFFKTQIDDKEGLPISDVNKSLKITTNSLENLSTKINNNCSSLDEKKVGQISFTAFENATQRAAFAHANTERLEKNPERVAHSFEQMENALNSLFNSIKRYCPDAVRNFDLQDSHHAVEMALKGKNKEALLDLNSARDSNVINQNFTGIAPRTAVVTNDAPLEWLGNTAENQPIISENQKIISSSNNQQFTPPFQPPL